METVRHYFRMRLPLQDVETSTAAAPRLRALGPARATELLRRLREIVLSWVEEVESPVLTRQLATELAAMKRLHELSMQLIETGELSAMLDEVLHATLELQGADFGLIQLCDSDSDALEIAAQHGFDAEFLDRYQSVREPSSASGRALKERRRVIIEDVASDAGCAPYRALAARYGFRAIQATPLFGRGGELLGTISTYFRRARRPSERQLRLTDLYARQAAEMVEHHVRELERERLHALVERDDAERKATEEALRAAQDELAHATRVVSLGELTASIAHEVSQPLAAIVTNGHACLNWLGRDVPDLGEVRAAVSRMLRDGERAGEVVRRLRSLSSKAQPQETLLDINDVVREVLALTQREIVKQQVEVRFELAANLALLGDRIQMQQVLLNLVANAVQAMASVDDRPRELLISSHDDGRDRLLLHVRDCGRGVADKQLERIFEPFYSTKPTGLGLGLSISHRIIAAYGGQIWASENDDYGLTLSIAMPAQAWPESGSAA